MSDLQHLIDEKGNLLPGVTYQDLEEARITDFVMPKGGDDNDEQDFCTNLDFEVDSGVPENTTDQFVSQGPETREEKLRRLGGEIRICIDSQRHSKFTASRRS